MEINELKKKVKHAIQYLNDPKINKDKLTLPHRMALESRIETLADIVLLIDGNQDVDLTNLFWN